MLHDASEAMQVLGDSSTRYQYQRNEVVSLAILPTLTHDLLPRVLSRFETENPQVRINVLDLFAGEVNEVVADGQADFGIGFIGLQEPGLEFDYLLDDRFVAVVQAEHPLAHAAELPWTDLASHRLIVPQKGGGNRLLIDTALARSQHLLNWSYQARYSSTILELVKSGIGVGILPASAVSNQAHTGLVACPLVEPAISRSIGAIRRSNRRLSDTAQRLFQLFLEECYAEVDPAMNSSAASLFQSKPNVGVSK